MALASIDAKPKIVLREVKDNFCEFVISNVHVAFANALRRTLIGEVPSIAIEFVEIEINNSCMTDEFLAHRVGLIPLRSECAGELIGPYDMYEGEVDEIEFTLHVKNEKEEHLMVMSTDLITGSDSRSDVVPIGHADFCQDPETNKAVPLVKLKKGQEIKFKAIAQKGVGKDHAKFSPVATASYCNMAEFEVNPEVLRTIPVEKKRYVVDEFLKCFPFKKCPVEISPDLKDIKVINPEVYSFDGEFEVRLKELGFPELVTVKEIPNTFLFRIESTGVKPSGTIVYEALQILVQKMQQIQYTLDNDVNLDVHKDEEAIRAEKERKEAEKRYGLA